MNTYKIIYRTSGELKEVMIVARRATYARQIFVRDYRECKIERIARVDWAVRPDRHIGTSCPPDRPYGKGEWQHDE